MNEIREVYQSNLEEEMEFLASIAPAVDIVCLSCEFGGVVCRPLGQFRSQQDYHYQTMRSNVELVNPLQIAITVADSKGKLNLTWQFNMRFQDVMFQHEIVESLLKTGANLNKMAEDGVSFESLGSHLFDSGLLGKIWVSQHAGYDFGYLIHGIFGKTPLNIEGMKMKLVEMGGGFVDLKWGGLNGNGNGNGVLGVQAGHQSQSALLSFLVGDFDSTGGNLIYGFD